MSRETLNRSFDATQVPPILARPSGGNPKALVIRSELDELVQDILDKVAQLKADTQQTEAADTENWTTAVSDLQRQVDERLDGVKASYAVATRIETVADASPDLPGLDTSATDWHSWILVAGTDTTQNGVYQYRNGILKAVVRFNSPSVLTAGVRFFDDHENQYWNVSADAVGATDGTIASVEITPGARTDRINGGVAMERIADRLNLLFDDEILAIANNQLTLSSAFLQRVSDLETSDHAKAQLIEGLQTTVAGIEATVAELSTTVERVDTATQSLTSQVSDLIDFRSTTLSRLTQVESKLSDLEPQLQTLEQTDLQQQQTLDSQGQTLTRQADQLADQGIAITAHTRQLAAQQASIDNAEGLITDARATIVAHTQKLGAIDTQLEQKLSKDELDALEEAKLGTLIKTFVLTQGVTEHRIDPDDGTQYYFTEFKGSTGWGHLKFRSFDLSEVLAPYTKRGYSYIFQRVDVDSYRVVFESSTAFFPDDKVEISLIRIPKQLPVYGLKFDPGTVSIAANTLFGMTLTNPEATTVSWQWYRNGAPVGPHFQNIAFAPFATFFGGQKISGGGRFNSPGEMQAPQEELGAGEWFMRFTQDGHTFDSDVLTVVD